MTSNRLDEILHGYQHIGPLWFRCTTRTPMPIVEGDLRPKLPVS